MHYECAAESYWRRRILHLLHVCTVTLFDVSFFIDVRCFLSVSTVVHQLRERKVAADLH